MKSWEIPLGTEKSGAAEYTCGYILHFSDGGDVEATMLHRGTQEECEEVGRGFPGVAYKGPRLCIRAEFVIMKLILDPNRSGPLLPSDAETLGDTPRGMMEQPPGEERIADGQRQSDSR